MLTLGKFFVGVRDRFAPRLAGTLLLVFAFAVATAEAYTRSTADGNGADEDVIEETPTDAGGGRDFLELRSRNVAGSLRHRVPFLRFDLSTLTGPVTAATLRFWIASSGVDTDSFAIDVFGVNNAVTGENNWSASALTYNNAPGLTSGGSNINRDHEAGNVTYLGTVTYPGGNYTGGVSLTTAALMNFINADTNGAVTIFLEPQVAATGEDFLAQVRTEEGVGTQANDFAPTLDLLAPAKVTDNGTSVTLNNGIISAVFTKADGECSDLRQEGGANLLANGGVLYLDSNSGGNYYGFTGTYQFVGNTPTQAHIRFTGRMGEITAELNYVLQRGESGFHCYVVFRHGAGDAATFLEQARMVLRCDKNVFTNAFSSESKTGQMIAPSLLASAPEIMDATY